jgi:hypothetical protein
VRKVYFKFETQREFVSPVKRMASQFGRILGLLGI